MHIYVYHICIYIYETWLVHMCDMTHSYLRHDASICATWRIHMCDMTHSYVWHDAFICDMTHSYWSNTFDAKWHFTKKINPKKNSAKLVTILCVFSTAWYANSLITHIKILSESCHTYECIVSHVRMRHVSYTNESCHIYKTHLEINIRFEMREQPIFK